MDKDDKIKELIKKQKAITKALTDFYTLFNLNGYENSILQITNLNFLINEMYLSFIPKDSIIKIIENLYDIKNTNNLLKTYREAMAKKLKFNSSEDAENIMREKLGKVIGKEYLN